MTSVAYPHSQATLLSLKHLDTDKIAFEFARNHCGPKHPIEVLLMDCGITGAQFAALADDALFQRKVRDFVKQLTEDGTSFRLKAQVLAEDLLKVNYRLANSKETPPSVAEKLIANTVRWAGLEKRPDTENVPIGGGPKININISLGDPASADSSTNPTTSITIDAATVVPVVPTTNPGEEP
jgi:hypothetical protein